MPFSPDGKSSIWCDTHWQPIVDEKLNGIKATALLGEMLLSDSQFIRMCEGNLRTGQKPKAKYMNIVTKQLSPICCYFGAVRMQELYDKLRKKPGFDKPCYHR